MSTRELSDEAVELLLHDVFGCAVPATMQLWSRDWEAGDLGLVAQLRQALVNVRRPIVLDERY